MSAVLNIPKESIKAKVSSILQNKKSNAKEVYDKLKSSFVFGKDFKTESLSQYEIMRAKDLAEQDILTFIASGLFYEKQGACYVERGA